MFDIFKKPVLLLVLQTALLVAFLVLTGVTTGMDWLLAASTGVLFAYSLAALMFDANEHPDFGVLALVYATAGILYVLRYLGCDPAYTSVLLVAMWFACTFLPAYSPHTPPVQDENSPEVKLLIGDASFDYREIARLIEKQEITEQEVWAKAQESRDREKRLGWMGLIGLLAGLLLYALLRCVHLVSGLIYYFGAQYAVAIHHGDRGVEFFFLGWSLCAVGGMLAAFVALVVKGIRDSVGWGWNGTFDTAGQPNSIRGSSDGPSYDNRTTWMMSFVCLLSLAAVITALNLAAHGQFATSLNMVYPKVSSSWSFLCVPVYAFYYYRAYQMYVRPRAENSLTLGRRSALFVAFLLFAVVIPVGVFSFMYLKHLPVPIQ